MFIKVDLECLIPLDEGLRQAFTLEEATDEQICTLDEFLENLEEALQERFGEEASLKISDYESSEKLSKEETIGDYI